ncbi:related to OMA1-Metalloendopeptidase of the mitochondrial inner membrane [Sporisorium reilianum f. sp. reilianum]|uniref:Related to OMA1-Metalloendopeptidase of the mitochondrial inner membrane n=1 Tax=Sporisorium reilianum f. sp. reilianum TaxID=72559 RepID=A0A2N8UA39_9BASI|nr:related to OMA1-Metalloendopeptidase of the mitochondrial inner membrane [Sporisorium reilianum f. sp. reilianum]
MSAPIRTTTRLFGAVESLARQATRDARSTIRTTPAISSSRLLHSTSSKASSYRRFNENDKQWPSPSQSQPSRREQLSPEVLRKQLEDQLFRRVGQVGRQQAQSRQPVQYQRFGGGGGSSGSGGRGRGSLFSSRPPTLILVALGGAGIYYVVHLEQVPETGRWRFINVSAAQEHELGQETFRQTLAEYRDRILPASHPYSKQVRAVASRIVAALDQAVDDRNQPHHTKGDPNLAHHSHGEQGGISYGSHAPLGTANNSGGASWFGAAPPSNPQQPATKWEVFVIDDPKQKNAFVLPGGKIFVFTGILPVCKNADGLATVLGHEVAHQVARHSAEKMSGYKVLLLGSFLLDAFGFDIGLSRAALTLLLSLPNSRKTELEADYLGLRIMSRACFDPREASRLWTRMSESEGASAGGVLSSAQAILSTHPVSSQRIKNMDKWLPEALETRQASDCPAPEQIAGFRSAASLSPF